MTYYDRPSAVLDEPELDFLADRDFGEPSEIHFHLLETTPRDRGRRWRTFGAGWLVQVLGIALIIWVTIMLRTETKAPEEKESVVKLYLPPMPKAPPRRTEPPQPRVAVPAPTQQVRVPQPPPKPRVPTVVAAAKPVPAPPRVKQPVIPSALAQPEVPKWKPKVAVGSFNANPAPARAHLPAAAVQTGGFGNPNGLPGQAHGPGNVPKVGAFDLASGPGNGNGSGGEHGARGAVASAGFGSAEGGSPARSGGSGRVQAGGFGDEGADSRVASASPRQAAAESNFQPVEILVKPDPVYTQEARQLHIQGEVVLQVVFAASGELRVIRVVEGLGHGLDEAAVRAARAIRFKPAQRGGQPVDTNATLRILFQLAE